MNYGRQSSDLLTHRRSDKTANDIYLLESIFWHCLIYTFTFSVDGPADTAWDSPADAASCNVTIGHPRKCFPKGFSKYKTKNPYLQIKKINGSNCDFEKAFVFKHTLCFFLSGSNLRNI